MITEKIICDRCEKELNGKGYSVSCLKNGNSLRINISSKINEIGDSHFCGRQCLMIFINSLVDDISKNGGEKYELTEH